jgi:1-acyl-sn-glycerol-3-phosphate acyltransferase
MTGGPDPEAPRASTGGDPTDGPAGPAQARTRPDDADPGPAGAAGHQGGTGPANGGTAEDEVRPGAGPGEAEGPAGAGGTGSAEPEPGGVTDAARDRAGPDGADPDPGGATGGRNTLRGGDSDPERGYRIAAMVVKPLMRTWFRIRLVGEEHIPEVGPVILASNHRSNMDPVLLASAVRRPVAFMAKAELFVGPLGWILRWIGQFPVRRGGIDREALRRVDAILARGSMLGLFPEGTRGEGGFAAVHPGLAYIVVRQRCPVLPVAILGTERVRRRFGWLPFASPVRIVIGPAIDLPQSTSDRAGRRAASELLRQRLQAFLASAGGTTSTSI